jgi:hypothetical protein
MPYLWNNSAFCFIWNINALIDSHDIIGYRVRKKKKSKNGTEFLQTSSNKEILSHAVLSFYIFYTAFLGL